MSQNCQKHNFGRFEWCFWHIILCFWHFFQIQSITFRQKQVFAKILCGRKTYFFYRNSLENLSERLLKPQKILTERPPWKDSLPLLLPERGKEDIPRKSFISGLSKGVGGGRQEKKSWKKREKTEMPSMARNGLEGARKTERGGRRKEPCGEEDTHKALMITLFLLPLRKN